MIRTKVVWKSTKDNLKYFFWQWRTQGAHYKPTLLVWLFCNRGLINGGIWKNKVSVDSLWQGADFILYKKIGNPAAHTEFDNIWLFSGSTNGKWLSWAYLWIFINKIALDFSFIFYKYFRKPSGAHSICHITVSGRITGGDTSAYWVYFTL